MIEVKKRSDCPISFALDFFGDKWTLLIIRDMVFDQKRFYKDFVEGKEGMATNILSDRLKKLEAAGVIESRVYAQLKTRKEYSLTQKGKDLVPVLLEMMVWSAKYDNTLNVPSQFIANVKRDWESVLGKILAKLE